MTYTLVRTLSHLHPTQSPPSNTSCVLWLIAVESVTPLGSDAGREFVMKLSPLPQLPAAKIKNKKRKKTPAERNADALYAEHLLYKNHLRDQRGIPYVPLGAYGEDKVPTELTMQLR